MPSIAQIYRRNKRENLEQAKRRAFEAKINHLVETGQLNSDASMTDRVHALLKVNRPGIQDLPTPVRFDLQPEPPAPVAIPVFTPLFDLLIAVKKYGVGSNSRDAQNAPIVWIKFAGEDKRPPKQPMTLAHPAVQKFLQNFELADTECRQFEIVRKYRKVEEN